MTDNVAPLATQAATEQPPVTATGKVLRRTALGIALVAAFGGAAVFGYQYWTVGRYLESTDDAYVKADASPIAPKVSGYIAQVLVEDNAPVKAGQLLARIDDRDFKTALSQATADVDAADAAIRNLDAQIVLQQSIIAQAEATVAASVAALQIAQDDVGRYRTLVKAAAISVQRTQQAETALYEARAVLNRDRAGLVAARNKINVLATQRGQLEAQRSQSQAKRQQAELNLSYTAITAPVAGIVGTRTVRVGQFVQAGTQLMAVVPLQAVYVVANFKETQLTEVRDGQPVAITVDSYPDIGLQGHVDSLSPASGLVFSLLPPDNATGNFTKIVQRIPVKIVFDQDLPADLLRPGMSVETTIDTHPKANRTAARTANADRLASDDSANGHARDPWRYDSQEVATRSPGTGD